MRSLRRALAALAVAGFFAGPLALALVLTSDHAEDKAFNAVLALVVTWSFVGTGLYAWLRRPANRFGALMAAVGFAWALSALIYANAPGVFTVGLLLNSLPFAFFLHMLMAFPSGELQTRLERWLVALAYVMTTLGQLILFVLVEPHRIEDACDGCPGNKLLIDHQEATAEVIVSVETAINTTAMLALVAILFRRWRAAAPAHRRILGPIWLLGGVTLLLLVTTLTADVTSFPDEVEAAVDIVSLLTITAVPFAFLAGLLHSRVSRATAVSDLVGRLSESDVRRGRLRDALADALGDPTISLAYFIPERDRYVDAEGRPFERPEDSAWTPVELEGRPVGAIAHDPALLDEPELLRGVAAAAGLALENERLEAQLRARIEELRASRARIVAAADGARRRIERDLHDGAQQRLVALALNLRLARSKLGEDPAGAGELLDETMAELETATAELRELARGIHPAVLSDRGLRAALDALAGRAPLPVELLAAPDERLPAPVESAAYFVVAEALTNVARYANASHAQIAVERANGRVRVEVRDDGAGGADPDAGSGLRGLADRLAALDGRLRVHSPPGGGTTVSAEIPCEW